MDSSPEQQPHVIMPPPPLVALAGWLVPGAGYALIGQKLRGIVVGVTSGGYWALAALAALGGVLAGLEHRDGWGGADRGLVGGALFGLGVVVAHAIAGTHAKVSLGSFPPFVIVIDAIVGMLLGALGGRLARSLRRRPGVALHSTPDSG